jgi:hypothetical protein
MERDAGGRVSGSWEGKQQEKEAGGAGGVWKVSYPVSCLLLNYMSRGPI